MLWWPRKFQHSWWIKGNKSADQADPVIYTEFFWSPPKPNNPILSFLLSTDAIIAWLVDILSNTKNIFEKKNVARDAPGDVFQRITRNRKRSYIYKRMLIGGRWWNGRAGIIEMERDNKKSPWQNTRHFFFFPWLFHYFHWADQQVQWNQFLMPNANAQHFRFFGGAAGVCIKPIITGETAN